MLSRRWARQALAPCILALSACAMEGDATRPERRPNVLLIVVDALRFDALGINGHPLPTSPRLDRLAAEGVSLPRAHAHSTWTKPSMATLFTSLYPPQHGLEHVAQDDHGVLSTRVLLDEVHTLAESLASAGYQTAGVLDQVHLQDRFGFRQGFADYADLMGAAAPELNRQLFRWWEAKGREPFFAYVHYLDAHWPYTHRVRDQDRLLFGPPHLPSRPPRSAERAESWAEGLSEREVAALRARYDAEVSWVDAAIGALLDELETRGLLADTLVVVTSDHGEAFMEHGRIMHGHEPHRELTHVPLILRPPTGWTPFAPVEEVVGLIDVMPTLLDLLGLEVPADCQGRSFAPALRGEPLVPQPHYAEGAGAVAVRTRDLTLLYRDTHSYELFDTRDDPGETTPVLWPCAGPCERLLKGAETYRERMERRVKRRGRVLEALTAEDLAALRALGYL